MLGYIPIDQKAISKQLMSNQPTILLSMSRASDRRLIRKNFPERYTIIEETETSPAELTYDLCITDLHSLQRTSENQKTSPADIFTSCAFS